MTGKRPDPPILGLDASDHSLKLFDAGTLLDRIGKDCVTIDPFLRQDLKG